MEETINEKTSELIQKHEIRNVHSKVLNRDVDVDIYIPTGYQELFPILILNDGQDSKAVKVQQTLQKLIETQEIEPVIIANVYAGDRLQEYGVNGKPDYAKRGSKASMYDEYMIHHLLPFLNYTYPIDLNHPKNTIAGYSLGGLSALDIAWNNPNYFKQVGAFSGSFWWRKRALNNGYTDADRIMHHKIKTSKNKPELKFWLQAGTHDEMADRNNNGIIDAIDDTLDIVSELVRKGYKPYRDVVYYEMEHGEHNQKTWAKAMPVFLKWAYGK